MPYSADEVAVIVHDYARCALWSSYGDTVENLDDKYGVEDIHTETMAKMREDVEDFLALIERERPGVIEQMRATHPWSDPGQVGHDFWLTRHHHGTGFWDRWYNGGPESELGDFLTKWAHTYGDFDLYENGSTVAH